MSATVLEGDVFDLLPTLRPGSVDCCVTSPPYWQLRSYLPKGHALKPRELGGERTPAEFVANMVRVFRLVREALADHGTVWLNMGDSYANGGGGGCTPSNGLGKKPGHKSEFPPQPTKRIGIAAGNLCLVPQRLAIALQDDGWLVRSVVVWHKPAPMPASVSGWAWRRCRVKVKAQAVNPDSKKYEAAAAIGGCVNQGSFDARYKRGEGVAEWQDCPGCKKCEPHGGHVLRRGSWRPTSAWEPVLMLAKGGGYYADGEAVKTPPAAATVSRDNYTRIIDDGKFGDGQQNAMAYDHETVCDGANLRDVWTVAAEPLREKHYAAFPTELVRRCLMAGLSAKGYCPACGKPWARVLESAPVYHRPQSRAERGAGPYQAAYGDRPQNEARSTETATLGWRPSCACPPADPRPGLVLDPFCGSGRTGVVAQRLGHDFVGCELNPDYVAMARRVLRDEMPLFAGNGGDE